MKKLIIIALLLQSGIVEAQQLPQFSQYARNQYMINPAAAGVYDFVDITMGGRMQWMGLTNSPKTAYLMVSTPLKMSPKYNPKLRTSGPIQNPVITTGKLKHAVGGQVIMDQYGSFRKLYFGGSYALHIPLSRKYNMSFGTRLGLSNNTFLDNNAITLNPTLDNTYQSYISQGRNQYIMNLGFGMYVYSNNLFVGIAADDVTRDLVNFGNVVTNFDTKIHLNFTAGYKIKLNSEFTLTPSILVKYMNPAPVAIEGTLQLEYKEWIWLAVNYRHKDAIIPMIGLNISNKFKIGYSYDITTSRLSKYSSGSHELILGLMLGR